MAGADEFITLRELFAGGYLSERGVEYLEADAPERDWSEIKIHVGDRTNEDAIRVAAATFEHMVLAKSLFDLAEAGADEEELRNAFMELEKDSLHVDELRDRAYPGWRERLRELSPETPGAEVDPDAQS